MKSSSAPTEVSHFTVSFRDRHNTEQDWVYLADGPQGLSKGNQNSVVFLEFYFNAANGVPEKHDDII